jgi:putative inorganic carbon (hco3(-)) transporter
MTLAPVLLFAAALYLNLPVLAAREAHVPAALTGGFALLLLLVPFLTRVVARRASLVLTPALGPMIAYLLVLVVSAVLAGGGASETVGPIATFLTEGLLLYALVTNLVRTPEQLRAVVWTVVAAGALLGLISLWQEATHSYHNTLGGLAQVDQTGFDVGTDVHPRLAGPIGEKNRYAQVLLVLVPLAVSRARIEPRRGARLAAAGAAGLIACGILLTFSRAAALAAAAVVLAMVALRTVSVRQAVAMALAAIALVVVVAPEYGTRLRSLDTADSALSQSSTADAAIKGRATENVAAFHVFRDHPLLGVGPGQFFHRYSAQYANALDLRFLKQNRRAHNLYLEIAADTGVAGLAAFLSIVAVTMAGLWRVRRRDPELAALANGLLAALIAYMATGVFLQLAYQRYFWFLVALANSAVWVLAHRRPGVPAEA